ncbi:murein transglycosylase A [Mesorhizobium sp. Z1-4]|uniref:murein transglycosylase A n=1 Tax=Mesorhizobium sp. Z1-4 TaxID=2448478 RepID=UPI000FD6BF7C|nr:murein transglycosylase A [Mesorhizobium sp. Z1-4]
MVGQREAEFVAESFDILPGWAADDHVAAFAAFRRCAHRELEKPYRSGTLGVPADAFSEAFAGARNAGDLDAETARTFFEHHFRPFLVKPEGGTGFVTGFYEPEARASRVRSEQYRFPVYCRPDDLIELDDTARPASFDPSYRFARRDGDLVREYFDRAAIERGALAGRGLEIAWLADRIDLFFIHIQGAARLRMVGGGTLRITYAAKSGHPFTGIGRVLADMGEIPLAQVTMQSIRAWLTANPERHDEILWQNRSFIFFREAAVDDETAGPVAAAKVPLTAGRSIAVDRILHTFATPFYVVSPTLNAFGGEGFRRLMIAQDTGSAIIGPARGDLFAGSGKAAGEIAGVIRNAADFHMLVPKTCAERFR